jgi:hypothetical protein
LHIVGKNGDQDSAPLKDKAPSGPNFRAKLDGSLPSYKKPTQSALEFADDEPDLGKGFDVEAAKWGGRHLTAFAGVLPGAQRYAPVLAIRPPSRVE